MLNHGVLAFEITIGSDTGKIFLLSLSAIAVYALARWGSSRSGQSENILTAESQSVSPVSSSKVSTSDPDDVLALFPADPNLGRIRITKFFFKKLDAIFRSARSPGFRGRAQRAALRSRFRAEMGTVVRCCFTSGALADFARQIVEVSLRAADDRASQV